MNLGSEGFEVRVFKIWARVWPRVSKFVVENVFNNSHIEYNNECDNNNNINDNEI